jgi:hypothetical protein
VLTSGTRGPPVSGHARGEERDHGWETAGGSLLSRLPSTSATCSARAPWPESVTSCGQRRTRGGAGAGDRLWLINGARRTGERERELRPEYSPRVKRERWRSFARRWQTTVKDTGAALPWRFRASNDAVARELQRARARAGVARVGTLR